MSDRTTIAVVGATGAQGGGLARAIPGDPERRFALRAITRKTDSDKARALAAAGAEVVAGDADDPASLERAFAGVHGAFLVTNFWEHSSPERESKTGDGYGARDEGRRCGARRLVDARRHAALVPARRPASDDVRNP